MTKSNLKTKSSKSPIVFPALREAFPHTLPIMAGFAFIGLAYGIYMSVSGFSWVYPLIMSLLIFGGSLEFICVTMLLSSFAPLSAFLMALMVQARHIFYGLSMLDKYKNMGPKKIYLVFGLCDETFSINYTAKIPENIDRGWFYFWVTLLNHMYWVIGATLGGLLGNIITFDTRGIDFVMTSMFVVIFLEQVQKEKQPYTAIIGIASAVVCRIIFGADSFIIPTMISILTFLAIFKKPISKAGGFV